MNSSYISTKLTPAVEKFIKAENKIQMPNAKDYEYLNPGAVFDSVKPEAESKVHKYLSPYAVSESVSKEFGKALDIIA